jgi:hypothetical protein
MDYELDHRVPSGGSAKSGGGFYHLSFHSGSRAKGSSAHASYEYVAREGAYDDRDHDDLVYTESDHMPSWAHDDPEPFWDAADLYERANGRLYVSADFALPRDLDTADQIALAREFAHDLTDEEHLAYTLAIHAGRDQDGEAHNPHAHLMFSERQNDGLERSRDAWFRRANAEHPERGGAPKSRTFHGPDWIEQARERWAELTNAALARAGRSARVDHRSYERQGVDREPGEHYGPAAAHMVGRDPYHDRLERASAVVDDAQALQAIESQIARLEAAKEAMLRDGLPDDERQPERRDYSHSSFSGHSDDRSWER